MEIPLGEKHGGGIKIPNLKLQCHINTYLMEDFIKKETKGHN